MTQTIEIHEIGRAGYWTGASQQIGPADPCPPGWTRAALPELAPGQFAVFEAPDWILTEEPLAPVEVSLDDRKAALLDRLADLRWQHETGGIVAAGLPVRTDRESQSLLTGAYAKAARDPQFAVRWKVAAGSFFTLDAATILALGDAVSAHVQACFAHEETLTDEVLGAADHDALDAVDLESGWPE